MNQSPQGSDGDLARIELVAEQVRRVMRLLRASANEDWASLSLTRAQLRILVQLQQEGPATVGKLACQLGVTLPSITATVDRLVQQGLVTRTDDPGDRRRVINQLTPAGTALIERLQEGKRARLTAALEQLPLSDLQGLTASLARLEDAILRLPAAASGPATAAAPRASDTSPLVSAPAAGRG
jgi:DNA-binding MarR family transcriptional regulator